jgi:hypothetical protein
VEDEDVDDRSRHQQGMTVRRAVLGDTHVDPAVAVYAGVPAADRAFGITQRVLRQEAS